MMTSWVSWFFAGIYISSVSIIATHLFVKVKQNDTHLAVITCLVVYVFPTCFYLYDLFGGVALL